MTLVDGLKLLNDPPIFQGNEKLVVGCLRNESLRLPDFLRHYRAIGVDHFLLIDNSSDDGSRELLEAEGDVTIFWTEEPYGQSDCGLAWLNAVLHAYGSGHWCLTVDIDEQFVFPDFEHFGLNALVEYLDARGFDAVLAPLLDMYPDGPLTSIDYASDQTLLDASPWFDPDGYTLEKVVNEVETIQRGGPRQRLFWDGLDLDHPAPFLRKVPMVMWRPELKYAASTHLIEGVSLADVTGLLLHFKILNDFADNAQREVNRKQHFADARQYQAYHDRLLKDPGLVARTEGSLKWKNSQKMVELNLMTEPEDFPVAEKPKAATTASEPSEEEGHWKDFLVRNQQTPHLGGNLRHGDGQTSTPVLWQALIDRFAPRSMLDVGAGEAHAAAFFARRSIHAHGIDGLRSNVANARHPIALHDFAAGPYVYPCDLTYCVEVVEHVDEAYVDALLDTLANAPIVVMTHAEPGQRGHHHVNLQDKTYWIKRMIDRGYRLTIDNQFFRDLAARENPDAFFAKTGLIFLRSAADRNDYPA